MRQMLIAVLLASEAACGATPSEPPSEPPTRETPAVPEPAQPVDPLADASPMPAPAKHADMPSVLADATLAFSLDLGRVAGHLEVMREWPYLEDLVRREMVDAGPVLDVLGEDLVEGSRIEGALWSTPRNVLAEALEIIEKDDGPWSMARAMPAAIVSHVRLELDVGDPTRTLERIAALRWKEPKRQTEVPSYDWDDPDACAELPTEVRGAWCLDRGKQVLVARATAEGIRLDAVQFHWPRKPLGIVAVEELAGVWPNEGVDLAARIEKTRGELTADAGGVDPTLQPRVAALEAALERQAATGAAATTKHDLLLQIDAARAAAYAEARYLAEGAQTRMAARLTDHAYRLVTGGPPESEPFQLEPRLAWEGVLPAQLAFEGVRIAWSWAAEGRQVDLRWKRNAALPARAVDGARPGARRAELCHEATACAGVGSPAASLLAVAPVDEATMRASPFPRYEVETVMLVVAGLWPHVVASAVSGRLPTEAPAEATAALATWAPFGKATPPRWGVSIAAADATEERAIAAWGGKGSFGRGPVVEVGELVAHRVAISRRDAILGVGHGEDGHLIGHLASSAGRLAWLAQLPWDAAGATEPDAFLFVRDMPALVLSTRFLSASRIFHRTALARMLVEDEEVLLRIELADPLVVPEGA